MSDTCDAPGASSPTIAVASGAGRTWYVGGAGPYAPGQVMLAVEPHKPGPMEDDAYYKRLFKDCH